MARNLRSGLRQSLNAGLAGGFASNDIFTTVSLDLNFAKYKNLGPLVDATTSTNLVDFSRASSGTYVGSDGLIKTATTNYLLQSEDFSTTWNESRSTVSVNSQIAPNGTTTADTITGDGTTAFPNGVNQSTTTFAATGTKVFSVYAKAGTNSFVQLYVGGNVNVFANFDLISGDKGTVGSQSSAAITPVGNGWYRCSISTSETNPTTANIILVNSSSAVRAEVAGSSNSIYLWGAQLEQSSTVTEVFLTEDSFRLLYEDGTSIYLEGDADSVGEYIPTTSTINSAPRFNHNPTTGESLGLLVEESRTNLLTYSEKFDQAAWTTSASYTSLTTNDTVAPDGALTADTFVFAQPGGYFFQTATVIASTQYTFSFFRKTSSSNVVAIYDLSNTSWITQAASVSVQSYPDGWERVFTVFTTPSGCTQVRIYPHRQLGGTQTISFWGAQLE